MTTETLVAVTVTAEDIALGSHTPKGIARCMSCPLALALHRVGFPDAWVATSRWLPTVAYQGRDLLLPPDAMEFVQRIDRHDPVQPATFLIPVPA